MGTVQSDITDELFNTTLYNNGPASLPKKNISNIPVYSLDGPATSLIQEMILYSNGNEVERI